MTHPNFDVLVVAPVPVTPLILPTGPTSSSWKNKATWPQAPCYPGGGRCSTSPTVPAAEPDLPTFPATLNSLLGSQ